MHYKGRNTWARSNQIQENEPYPSSEEVLIFIMDSINFNEDGNMEVRSSTESLGVDKEVHHLCKISIKNLATENELGMLAAIWK